MNTLAMDSTLFTRTGRLFNTPCFREGMARVLDLAGTQDIYNENLTTEEADFFALYSDWASVGDHLLEAVKALQNATGSTSR